MQTLVTKGWGIKLKSTNHRTRAVASSPCGSHDLKFPKWDGWTWLMVLNLFGHDYQC